MNRKIFLAALLAAAFPAFAWTHRGTNIYGWKTETLTFYVNHTNCSLDEETLNSVIDTALNAWNGVPGTNLKLVRSAEESTVTESELVNMTASQSPVILCITDMSAYGDPDSIPGFSPGIATDSDGNVNFSGLILNSEPGAAADISQIDRGPLELILAHEVGHVLGLGHSSESEALMYYSVGGKTAPILTQDDQDGITHLYPRNEFSGGMYGCSAAHQREWTSVNWTTVSLLFAWLGLSLGLGRFLIRPERLL